MKKFERQNPGKHIPFVCEAWRELISLLTGYARHHAPVTIEGGCRSSRQQAWLKRVWKTELATAAASQGPETGLAQPLSHLLSHLIRGLLRTAQARLRQKRRWLRVDALTGTGEKKILCPSLPPPCSRRLPVGSLSASRLLPDDLVTCLVKRPQLGEGLNRHWTKSLFIHERICTCELRLPV